MAEHDDLVRQAAGAALAWQNHAKSVGLGYSNAGSLDEVLAPFFAAARKEAREGALEEAIKAIDIDRDHFYRDVEVEVVRGYGFQDGIDAAHNQLVLLRSKPKESASDPADQLLRSIAEQSNAPCPTGGKHIFAVTLDDHCIETIKRLTLAPEANETEARAAATDYRNRATGERIAWSAPPGELILTACAKCGLPGIVDLGWRTQPEETAR